MNSITDVNRYREPGECDCVSAPVGQRVLFISHSSRNNDAAIKVRDWLRSQGWNDVFLDLDPSQGLAPGHRWQEELKKAGERCSAVIVLVSPDWVGSRWCQTEFLLADQLGKRIFPMFVAPTQFNDLPLELKAKLQLADISTPEKETDGFHRLAIGLKKAGLDPTSFDWPPPGDPDRAIYRGLQSLDEQDAAILFGRDASITKGLDALRRMRDGAPERLLVILGASGAGKSSFLKAGLIARLKRDEECFLVARVIRPERAAVSGDHGLAASLALLDVGSAQDLTTAFAAMRAPVVDRLSRIAAAANEVYIATAPTIVIPIDQAEELFTAENAEAGRFMELLSAAVAADSNVVVVATIRTDSFARLQTEPRLAPLSRLPFDLAPMAPGAFKEVIEGPAHLARPPLAIEPALTDQLLSDLDAADALPLLAFTLERLTRAHGSGGHLALADYAERMGGLQGAIGGAIDLAFAAAAADPALPDDRAELDRLARMAFIPALVQIDDASAEPKRRVERLLALPEATRPLVRHFVDQRLLISDRRIIAGAEADVVEVAHEAILRQWPALRVWIDEERGALRALDTVRSATEEWRTHALRRDGQRGESWLAHRGDRLREAEALTTRLDFAGAFGDDERSYLAECRESGNQANQREERQLRRLKRLQLGVGGLVAVAALIVLIAGLGVARLVAGLGERSSNTLAELARRASDQGFSDRAARFALAGLNGAQWPLIGFDASNAEAELRRALTGPLVTVLRGHEESVGSAAISPDGTRIVTASDDDTARVWDAANGREIVVLRGHGDDVSSAVFSRDGTRILTASIDHTARVWDAASGREIAVLRGHEDFVRSASFSQDGTRIVTASDDDTGRVWDAANGREIAVLRGHEGDLYSAAFSRDGTRIITASDDETARVWDAVSGREIVVLRGHEDQVNRAAFSQDGTRIVTASDDDTARVWDAVSGREIAALRGHDDDVSSAVFSRDGTRILTAASDDTARVWDAASGSEIAVLRGHEDFVRSASYSRDETRILTASDDDTARVWDAANGREIVVLRGHGDDVLSAAFSRDETRIVTGSSDCTARVWDANNGREMTVLRREGAVFEAVTFSPDGTRIATGADDSTAQVWSAASGREIASFHGHESFINSAAFNSDGRRIVTASSDDTARVWDAASGREIAVLRGHEAAVRRAAFSRDGTRVVTASHDQTARVWDAANGREIAILRGHEALVLSAEFSRDGTRIVTSSRDGTARVWDATNGREIASLGGQEDDVASAAFSPDGTRVVTASGDRPARVWDATSGREISALRGDGGSVYSVAFSPDGMRIVTASGESDYKTQVWRATNGREITALRGHEGGVFHPWFSPDGTRLLNGVQVLDAANGREITALRGHEGSVSSVAFSPDGTRILTAANDGTARVWQVPASVRASRNELRVMACTGPLSHETSRFTSSEMREAPVLNPVLDTDVCAPPTLWMRLDAMLR